MSAVFSVCLPVSAASDLVFSATPTLGSMTRIHEVLSLRVDLRTSRSFAGRIVARIESIPGTTVEIPVNVGRGQFKYDLAVPISEYPQENSVKVRLLDSKNRLMGERDLTFEHRGMPYYGAWHGCFLLTWIGPECTASRYGGAPSTSAALSGTTPELLPEDPCLYDAVDALVIPAASAAKLSKAQADAIDAWVRSGGQILVDGCCDSLAIGKSALLGNYRISPGEGRKDCQVSYRFAMYDPSRNQQTNQTGMLNLSLRSVSIGGKTCSDERSLRADIPVGLGRVVVTCVDLRAFLKSDETLRAGSFLRALVMGEPLDKAEPEEAQPYSYAYYGGRQITAPPWAQSLFMLTGLEAIPMGLVMFYLLLFMIVVCPVERLLLGRLNRLRWTWWTTGVTVLVFSLAANVISLAVRGTHPRRSMLCIHDYASEGGGRHTLFDCLIPSRSRSVTARYGARDVVRDVASREMGTTALFNSEDREVEFSAPVWSPHFFLTSRFHDETPPFQVEMRIEDGKPVGTARYLRDEQAIEKVWLAWNGRIYATSREGSAWKVDGQVFEELRNRGDLRAVHLNSPVDPSRAVNEKFRRQPPSEVRQRLINDVLRLDQSEELVPIKPVNRPLPVTVPAVDPEVAGDPLAFFRHERLRTTLAGVTDRARLIAVCNSGASLDIAAENLDLTSIHVIRQIVKIERP